MRNAPAVPDRRPAPAGRRCCEGRSLRAVIVWLLVAALGAGPAGCTTAQMAEPPSADALERIPLGTRVRIQTHAGEMLSLKVTGRSEAVLAGRDRYFRRYEIPREDIAAIEAPPQNDWWVALFFVGIVFVART